MRKDWEKWSDMVVCCLFNDTATTEINTYGHTLARPDALPICLEARSLMRILVTRPREDAAGLVTALTERGHAVLLEPLLAIVPRDAVDWPAGHQQAQALLVSSANGVSAFARADSRRRLPVSAAGDPRSEEGSGGTECVSTCK